ncbi:PaeR7I family type II restriction endonuclease [Streptomyces sp. NPDC056707]|uniref:PaeR7I family type II restriction endonuclease n=1 Tax=Streptomyces sp. NPDC056707 TaxID=3345919 RepID=UPI0036A9FD7D
MTAAQDQSLAELNDCVRTMWKIRAEGTQQGLHMESIEELIESYLEALGCVAANPTSAGSRRKASEWRASGQLAIEIQEPPLIFRGGQSAVLPGVFRPTKRWDIVIRDGEFLVAAIEVKSQEAKEIGNNINNRIEESLGSAFDLKTALDDGLIPRRKKQRAAAGEGERWDPWIGYLFVLEDTGNDGEYDVHKPVALDSSLFPVGAAFTGNPSYADRYKLLCERLVKRKVYSETCFLMSSKEDGALVSQPCTSATFQGFVDSLTNHVKAYLADKQLPAAH